MKRIVTGRWVAIVEASPDTVTSGGILIPEKAQKPYPYGTIVAVGTACESEMLVGDIAIFDHGMKHVLRNPRTGKELLSILHEESIFVIMDRESAEASGFIASNKTMDEAMCANMAPVTAVPAAC